MNTYYNKNHKTKNCCFVITRADHPCGLCHKTIKKGSNVLTKNPKAGKRYWVCPECYKAGVEIRKTKRRNLKLARNYIKSGNSELYNQITDTDMKDEIVLLRDVYLSKCMLDSIRFGDEGGYMACDEGLGDAIYRFEEEYTGEEDTLEDAFARYGIYIDFD